MSTKTLCRMAGVALFSVLMASAVVGQTADEEAIKKAVRAETDSWHQANADGWADTWVEYDQYMNLPGADAKNRRFSREYRVLARQDGAWKIVSQITYDPETFKFTVQNIEGAINNAGYAFLGAKKPKEAIEALRLNVRLYPNSANCYDSLGEAYALNGDKSKAIKNYEKALALDPKRDSSRTALAKLKE